MAALDKDWFGPPFDPIQLAELLGIEIRAFADIPDARTVAIGREKYRIEFNPNRPAGRVRYSIAHEIAHTFFPDCGARVRNRLTHADTTQDDWQLEALCNIAAAEILMPLGSLPNPSSELLEIGRIIELQRVFKLSVEAVLLRVVKLAPFPCAAFAASRVLGARDQPRWRIDYVVGSSLWQPGEMPGDLLPLNTLLQNCTERGYTEVGNEVWRSGRPLHVEAVGLPPYPGSLAPRASGLIAIAGQHHANAGATVKEIVGDALKPRGTDPKVIAHVVPDRATTWGGAGFASAVRARWPHIQRDFTVWAGPQGRNLRLGSVRISAADEHTYIASMVAQHGYGAPQTRPRLRYTAFSDALDQVFKYAADVGASIHLPRVGTGHGGAAWEVVRGILHESVAKWQVAATVYRLPSATPGSEQIAIFAPKPSSY